MKNQLLIQSLIGGLLVALAFGLTVRLLSPFPGVTRESFGRVRAGMSLDRVEAIFGGPAHDTCGLPDPVSKAILYWGGDEGVALIFFNAKGRVTKTHFTGGPEGEFLRSDLSGPKTGAEVRAIFRGQISWSNP
jgi:hypothetical protein